MIVTSDEMRRIRIDMLEEMNDFVMRNITNEQDLLLWHCFCIPINPTKADYEENAMDDEFNDCTEFFAGIVERAGF